MPTAWSWHASTGSTRSWRPFAPPRTASRRARDLGGDAAVTGAWREAGRWEGEQLLAAQEPDVHDLSTWESWARWRDALVRFYLHLGRWACPIGSLTWEAAQTDPRLQRQLAGYPGEWRGLLVDGVRRLQEAGGLDASASPERLGATVQAAIQGGLLLSGAAGSSEPLEQVLDTVLDLLRRP